MAASASCNLPLVPMSSNHSATMTVVAATAAAAALAAGLTLFQFWSAGGRRSPASSRPVSPIVVHDDGVVGMIGNTPLVRLTTLSELTGCDIYGKAEFLNPGGSSKDRVALSIITEAERRRDLVPHTGATVFEGTVGSTGISLALLCRARGYRCHIVMPDDVASDKVAMLERLGATVERVRPVSIIDANHFVNVARRRAEEAQERARAEGRPGTGGVFANQFETLDNFKVHFEVTGPEVLEQTGGELDVFVMGAGTGGTLAGVARYLKPRIPTLRVVLADPQGSGLFNKIKHNVFYAPTEAEGRRRRHQIDTVVEGIGINRLTRNFEQALGVVDDAVRVTDQEAVSMARYLMREEGLFVGSSSAVNVVAAVKVAKRSTPGTRIVTLLCDSGTRHLTKFWSDDFLRQQGLDPAPTGREFIASL
ncbi:hypothetical protein AMAG_06913 [Allomyces macrogynus ATCC 38327]|uniref:cysteine synthase n=1 Tax=Allomyces macrogynus (strain ATCC 38327) TaxID=578462 RepID=A0A0L0SFD8_ALLM3|nr:hypothetical protein AMAG_06913 [Allomyces macrogynus ATCC 38327]|eukprot:KNE61162.1 hypothetical protein AMAG_06913 [Allomyces macrogynus ATCC 38327]